MAERSLIAQLELGMILVAVAGVVVLLFGLGMNAQERVNRWFGLSEFIAWVRLQPWWLRLAMGFLMFLLALLIFVGALNHNL